MKKLIWILPSLLLCSCWQEYIIVMVAEPTPILEMILGAGILAVIGAVLAVIWGILCAIYYGIKFVFDGICSLFD